MEELELLETQTSAMDAPDERDFVYEELFGASGDLPEAILPDKKTPVLNQGKTMRCTLYSCAGAITEQNYLEAREIGVDEFTKLTGTELVSDAIKLGFSEKDGWFVQSAVKLYRDKGYFEGYTKVTTDEGICQAIHEGKPLCSGSNKIVWSKSRSGLAVIGEGSGHAFFIVGYDKDFLYCKNSWGDKWGESGYFKVKRGSKGALFTCYALHDKSDAPVLYGHYAKKKGWCVLEDFRGLDKATREFSATLISKATGKPVESFWDGKIPSLIVTERTFADMMKSAGLKYEKEGVNVLKRWEVVKALRTALK